MGVRTGFCDFIFLDKQAKCHVPIDARYESIDIAIVNLFHYRVPINTANEPNPLPPPGPPSAQIQETKQ